MFIFDFITQDEIDELPDNDPQVAFTAFVRIAQRRLAERIKRLDPSNPPDWEEINEARYGFMNVVTAAGKKYEITPFSSLVVPRIGEFDAETHRQFRADLDHYLTQLLLDSSSRAKRDSVFIPPDSKAAIRTYVYHLRDLIEKSGDLDEAKRRILLKRLSEFEAALDKGRLSLMAVALMVITLMGAPGALWSSADAMSKLLANILRVVGEAKIADDATRQVPSEVQMAISGPRPHNQELLKRTGQENDDEIPF